MCSGTDREEALTERRADMVRDQLARRGITDERVLSAMRGVPRHWFVPSSLLRRAYEDMPLPIGHGQTISQPLMVAVMLQAAELTETDRVLEIGAGSGYQAALLSVLCREVVAIELLPDLADRARRTLAARHFDNVTVLAGDGSGGHPERAPYDAILVAAGAPRVPPPLIEQLAVSGRLLVPVGDGMQVLQRIRRTETGTAVEDLDWCAFVPLLGRYGSPPSTMPEERSP